VTFWGPLTHNGLGAPNPYLALHATVPAIVPVTLSLAAVTSVSLQLQYKYKREVHEVRDGALCLHQFDDNLVKSLIECISSH